MDRQNLEFRLVGTGNVVSSWGVLCWLIEGGTWAGACEMWRYLWGNPSCLK